MRTLSSDLTTAQRAASRTPFVSAAVISRSRVTTRTYSTTSATNRLIFAQQAEARWNGHINVAGSQLPISTVLRINDDDKSINVLDHVGYRVEINWGYDTSSGTEGSLGPPSFVVGQRSVSLEGQLIVELYCMSIWDLLRLAWAKQTITTTIKYNADVTVRHILMELLGGTSFATLDTVGSQVLTGACQQDDGTVFTDFTNEAIDPTDGADLGSADDIDLLPATPATNDAFYIGHEDQFEHVSIDMSTVGVGTWVITPEYWSGATFEAFPSSSIFVDNTVGFTTGELKTLSFRKPTDWATTTVNSLGPFYYIRMRVSSFTSVTTQPKATKITVHHEFSVSLDSATANQGDAFKPVYESDFQVNVVDAIQHLLSHSLLVVRATREGFSLFFKDDSVASVDYTYNSDHAFWIGVFTQQPVIPNDITYTNLAPGEPGTRRNGNSTNAASITAMGPISAVFVDDAITDNTEAAARAANAIKRLLRDSSQGEVEVPNNVGQEIWDVVEVQDSRSGQTYQGVVTQLVRTYDPEKGVYSLLLTMGGAERMSGLPVYLPAESPVEPLQQPVDVRAGEPDFSLGLRRVGGRPVSGVGRPPFTDIPGIPFFRTDLWDPSTLPKLDTQVPTQGRFSPSGRMLLRDLYVDKIGRRTASGTLFTLPTSDGSANDLLKTDGSAALAFVAPSSLGVPTVVFKTADESVSSSAALQNDDHLFFSVGANERWAFRLFLFGGSVSATPNMRMNFSLPANASGRYAQFGRGASTPTFHNNGVMGGGDVQVDAAGVSRVWFCDGFVLVGDTAGTVQMQWAQFTSNATAFTLLEGSWLIAWKA